MLRLTRRGAARLRSQRSWRGDRAWPARRWPHAVRPRTGIAAMVALQGRARPHSHALGDQATCGKRHGEVPMARRRVALIGLGMAVTPHARSLMDLHERVEVAAAYSPSEARRTGFAARFPFPTAASL